MKIIKKITQNVEIKIDWEHPDCCDYMNCDFSVNSHCDLRQFHEELKVLYQSYKIRYYERTNYCKELFGVPEVKDGN